MKLSILLYDFSKFKLYMMEFKVRLKRMVVTVRTAICVQPQIVLCCRSL